MNDDKYLPSILLPIIAIIIAGIAIYYIAHCYSRIDFNKSDRNALYITKHNNSSFYDLKDIISIEMTRSWEFGGVSCSFDIIYKYKTITTDDIKWGDCLKYKKILGI